VIRIRLETEDGGLVTAKEYLPPFHTLPAVVVWGQRVFRRDGWDAETGEVPLYRECFWYCLTGKEKELA
jgi:hypothetical protein